MKKILTALTTTLVTVGLVSGVSFASSSCDISNTGPDSNNTCTSEEHNDVHVSCKNGIYVVNDNDQDANSGDASDSHNTTGGNATSGSATNENGTTVQIGASCGTTTTNNGGGSGGGAGGSGGAVLGESTTAGGRGGAVESAQVVAPVGGVGAGAGAGVATNKAAAVTGLITSAGAVGLGLALRKRAFGQN
jgi:hypothetical protein